MVNLNINALTKKQQIAIAVWLVFSLLYVLSDIWTGFKVGIMENSYVAGKTDTAKALIEQAQNPDCKPFNVYVGDKKVDLINVKCVQQAGGASNAAPQPR
jgi:hypothetical protein